MKKEIPMLFSTPMVIALMNGSKTMTRRIVKPQPDENGVSFMPNSPLDWEAFYKQQWKPWLFDTIDGERIGIFCPYGEVGDLIWVRETFKKSEFTLNGFTYKALAHSEMPQKGFKPSIHMPKAAARIWLEITEIKIERLHDISEEDAIAEGTPSDIEIEDKHIRDLLWPPEHFKGIQFKFCSLWCNINGVESWNANPWVWVVKFKVLKN